MYLNGESTSPLTTLRLADLSAYSQRFMAVRIRKGRLTGPGEELHEAGGHEDYGLPCATAGSAAHDYRTIG